MPTDATGTPTSLGIRKYNTSVDAPSGLGFNGAMDDIDALLAARVTKPSGIANGEVPLWNGSTWVRGQLSSMATGVAINSSNQDVSWQGGTGPTTTYEIATGGGSARSIGAPSYAGQRVVFQNGSGSAVTFKHNLAGGTGVRMFLRGAADVSIAANEAIELTYDGVNWIETSRNTAGGATTYRKSTPKAVNTTTVATDLLNGEITVGAGAMGATGMLRFKAWGDFLVNAASGPFDPPRFIVKLGSGPATIFDTGTAGSKVNQDAGRKDWAFDFVLLNTATNAQVANMSLVVGIPPSGLFTAARAALTTGTGEYSALTNQAHGQLIATGFNTSAVDTTAAMSVQLQVVNGTSSAAYETKLYGALVEVV